MTARLGSVYRYFGKLVLVPFRYFSIDIYRNIDIFDNTIRQGCSLSGMLYALAIEPMLQQLREHICGLNLPICKSSISLSAYADDVVVLINGQNDVQVLMKVLEDFRVLSSAKVNWNKSEALLIGNWPKGKPSLPDGLTWGTGGFKYLGVYLGDEMSIQKNWEGVVDKVKGRLDKWKWLIPKLSYIGRTLIVNNLVASCLWHRLACLDPPAQILTKIQGMLVDFFGDKLHWVSQSVLYLPKEEGGHGLIHLKSRIAAFRLQFLQRFLYKSSINGWRAVTCAILHRTEGLGLDKSLFLIDPFKVNVNGLPVFHRNLFKVWSLFKSQRNETTLSLYWLLEEPLINGARFDLSNESCSFHGLNAFLQKSQIFTFGRLIHVAGLDFERTEEVAFCLKVRSLRTVEQMLKIWKSLVSNEEKVLLMDSHGGVNTPSTEDSFPVFTMLPKLDGCSGPSLDAERPLCLDLCTAPGKAFYKISVKVFNKNVLRDKIQFLKQLSLTACRERRAGAHASATFSLSLSHSLSLSLCLSLS